MTLPTTPVPDKSHAPFYESDTLADADVGYPLVALVCAGCGYTRFFNAVLMDLMDTAEEAGDG